MECAYCLSRNHHCDGAVPRCSSCRSVNILCSAPPDHPVCPTALRTADGPLAHHPAHRALADLHTGLAAAVSLLADSDPAWSSTLGRLPTSFPLGSIPLSYVLALPHDPAAQHALRTGAPAAAIAAAAAAAPRPLSLQPAHVLAGYMGDFVSGCIARYPLFSPEKAIGLSERYAPLVARLFSSVEPSSAEPPTSACSAAAPHDYARAMRADSHDLVVYLLVVAIGSLLEARRASPAASTAVYALAADSAAAAAPVPGLALFIEALVALQAQRLGAYKSLKAWRVRAWFLVGVYYDLLGLREAAQEAGGRAAEMLLGMGSKTGFSNLVETTGDGDALMLFWSLAQFQMDITTDPSTPNLLSSLHHVPLPTHVYASTRGFIADYGFSRAFFTLFCDRLAFLRVHADAAHTAPADCEALCATRLPGASADALCRGGASEAAALAWAAVQRARALSAVYRPLVRRALDGGEDGDLVFRGVEVLKTGVEVDEQVFGAWSALGPACHDVLLITQVCESLDLRCPVHADTAQAMADRMAQHLSAVTPSAVAAAAEAHLVQYAQLRG